MLEGSASRADGGASGLVYSQTTQNRLPKTHNAIHVDPVKARLSRLRHSTITAARLHQEQAQNGGFRGRWAMVTLTYAEVQGWQASHVRGFLDHCRKWAARKGFELRYVWVAELQKRGAMHYHALIWLPRGLTMPKPDKQGWWPHGYSKIEWARNAVGYMAKYASKGDTSAKFPKGARIHGCGGLRGDQLQEQRYWKRPTWLREETEIGQAVRRRSGGGWIDMDTGEIYASPYKVIFDGGQVWIIDTRTDTDTTARP